MYRFKTALYPLLLLMMTVPKVVAAGPHYVFAHYMVCYAAYGESVAGYRQEIQDAQAAGIDGFALNVGAWNQPGTWYNTNVEMMYEAAESLTNGFKLFFSIDMPDTNEIVQMVSAYAHRTNSFYYNGKLVLSAYAANNTDWTDGVLQPLQSQGINVFFVPDLNTEGGTWAQLPQLATALVAKYGSFIDGLFDFQPGLPSIPFSRTTPIFKPAEARVSFAWLLVLLLIGDALNLPLAARTSSLKAAPA